MAEPRRVRTGRTGDEPAEAPPGVAPRAPSGESPSLRSRKQKLSPSGQAVAAYLRQLSKAISIFRLYRGDSDQVRTAQEKSASALARVVRESQGLALRISPTKLSMGDEVLVEFDPRQHDPDSLSDGSLKLPLFFYSNGLRQLTLNQDMLDGDAAILVDAIKSVARDPSGDSDLVTLLWQANPSGIEWRAIDTEERLIPSTRYEGRDERWQGPVYSWQPAGSDLRADLGFQPGAQGLHRDLARRLDLPAPTASIKEAFTELDRSADELWQQWSTAWRDEMAQDWVSSAERLVRDLVSLERGDGMRTALASAISGWTTSALHRAAWDEVLASARLLSELWGDDAKTLQDLNRAFEAVDFGSLALRIDALGEREEQAMADMIRTLGKASLEFAIELCSKLGDGPAGESIRQALVEIARDAPEVLSKFLEDQRPAIVLVAIRTLQGVGGPQILDLLRSLENHPEPAVRRALIHALGAVPASERTSLLLGQLDSPETELVDDVLGQLAGLRDSAVTSALLEMLRAQDFGERPKSGQIAIIKALAHCPNDSIVEALDGLLHEGGRLAKTSVVRHAAAAILWLHGTPRSLASFERGIQSSSRAVRDSCLEALELKGFQ